MFLKLPSNCGYILPIITLRPLHNRDVMNKWRKCRGGLWAESCTPELAFTEFISAYCPGSPVRSILRNQCWNTRVTNSTAAPMFCLHQSSLVDLKRSQVDVTASSPCWSEQGANQVTFVTLSLKLRVLPHIIQCDNKHNELWHVMSVMPFTIGWCLRSRC